MHDRWLSSSFTTFTFPELRKDYAFIQQALTFHSLSFLFLCWEYYLLPPQFLSLLIKTFISTAFFPPLLSPINCPSMRKQTLVTKKNTEYKYSMYESIHLSQKVTLIYKILQINFRKNTLRSAKILLKFLLQLNVNLYINLGEMSSL